MKYLKKMKKLFETNPDKIITAYLTTKINMSVPLCLLAWKVVSVLISNSDQVRLFALMPLTRHELQLFNLNNFCLGRQPGT